MFSLSLRSGHYVRSKLQSRCLQETKTITNNINTNLSTSKMVSSLTQLNTCDQTKSYFSKTQSVIIVPRRYMAKKKDKTKLAVEKMVDSLVEDEEVEETVEVDIQNSQLKKFLSGKVVAKKGSKGGAPVQKLNYQEFTQIVNGEKLWREMDKSVEALKTFYVQNLTVRSSSSLDDLPIELEGDVFPLNELATISKKDPKRLIIDSSAFPEACKTIMDTIRNSGMNLNPQQDGLTIYVPIPKVTKEHRQNLADGAKKKLTESKNNIRKIQNTYTKKISEDENAENITKDDSKAGQQTVHLISEYFQSAAENLCNTKTKELLGQ